MDPKKIIHMLRKETRRSVIGKLLCLKYILESVAAAVAAAAAAAAAVVMTGCSCVVTLKKLNKVVWFRH